MANDFLFWMGDAMLGKTDALKLALLNGSHTRRQTWPKLGLHRLIVIQVLITLTCITNQ